MWDTRENQVQIMDAQVYRQIEVNQTEKTGAEAPEK